MFLNEGPAIRGVQAVLFDMDGTLIDSEPLTERTIEAVLAAHDIRAAADFDDFYGVTWQAIAERLVGRYPQLAGHITAQRLHATCHDIALRDPPPLLPGAVRAVRAAHEVHRTAIVTGSHRGSVEALLDRAPLRLSLDDYLGAEDYSRSKPDPECYLLAAARLGVAPAACLVFEDSLAGLAAARAAGMWVIAVVHRVPDAAAARELAHGAIADYRELPPGFFRQIRRPRVMSGSGS